MAVGSGRSLYKFISAPSNTVVKQGYGILHSITGTFPSGGTVRIDDSHSFGQGVLNINASSSNTVGIFGGSTTFGQGLGLNTGLVVAVSSNASITIEYE